LISRFATPDAPVLAFWLFFGAQKTTHFEAEVQMHSPMRIKR
jgi:hypothetical protein